MWERGDTKPGYQEKPGSTHAQVQAGGTVYMHMFIMNVTDSKHGQCTICKE